MTYSLIEPKIKPLFSMFTRLWLSFIGFVVVLMLIFDFFTVIRTKMMNSHINSIKEIELEYEKKTNMISESIKKILHEKSIVEEIVASNEMLKNEIKNNFNQVPDQITLTKVEMDINSLILYGSTPSKDLYNFVLALPLRARYDSSNTVFYLNKKGWYRFVSTNKINNAESYNE